jgi:hypothetical protein
MAITTLAFPLGWLNVFEAPIDIEAATNKLTLHTATMAPDRDTWDFEADLTNELATANGYTVGGVTIGSVAMTYDSATDQIRLDSADPSWTFSANVTFRYAVWWIDTAGADTTDPLLLLLTWDADQTVQGVYTLQLDPAGIYAIDFT